MEYKEVNSYWRTLTVIRFKLLAFVPTLAGLGVALIPQNTKLLEAFAIGLFGFIATLGITFYDQRNSQLYDASIRRAKFLEGRMNSSCMDSYLFTWHNVPGDDSKKLLKHLKYYHSIDWAKTRDISKCDDDNAICIVKGEKSAKIKIVTDKKATLEINDGIKRDDENTELYVKNGYLFSWDCVPGDDDEKLRKFLKEDLHIGWTGNAEIRKSNDGKTLSISKDEKRFEIILDVIKKKATLKISDDKTFYLNVKKQGKLNIYKLKINLKVRGIFNSRPKRSRTFFGILMWHDRALAMVYASALGAWLFIIISSIQKIIMDFHSIKLETFSLWLSVLLAILLAIVIYIFLSKD